MEATINGGRLAYEDVGVGEALLLVHAFPLSGAMWRPQVAALSGRYRLIVPDLRGFGASELRAGPALMEQHAADLLALCDQLGVERFALCGLSMGGYISFAIMRAAPERVRALVLADTKVGADSAEAQAAREANAHLAEEQGAAALADKLIPGLLAPAAGAALRAELRTMIAANPPQGIAAALRGMAARPDSSATLAAISVPTLVLVGSEDGLTPPAEAQKIHTAVAGSQLVEIPGAGHLANLEQPALFNAALERFLAGAMLQ
jgi:3-oxoadipate enol-lactonase